MRMAAERMTAREAWEAVVAREAELEAVAVKRRSIASSMVATHR